MIDPVPEHDPSETPAPPSIGLLGNVTPEPAAAPESPGRPRLIRNLTVIGVVLIVVSVVLTVVLISIRSAEVRRSTSAPSSRASLLVPGSAKLHGSAALARFFTAAATPPAAIEQTWGLTSAGTFYGNIDAGAKVLSVRFQSLGTVTGTSYWGVLGLDDANGGVVCLVTQNMKQQSTCETIAQFVATGDAFDDSPAWAWKRVTWNPNGTFGLLPLPGVSAAAADTPAFKVINNSAPALYRSAGMLNAAGTRLQSALNSPSTVFGEVRSAGGKVFGIASDTTLTTVCVSALDSMAPSCGSGATVATNGLVVATADGRYRWTPSGTIAPAAQ